MAAWPNLQTWSGSGTVAAPPSDRLRELLEAVLAVQARSTVPHIAVPQYSVPANGPAWCDAAILELQIREAAHRLNARGQGRFQQSNDMLAAVQLQRPSLSSCLRDAGFGSTSSWSPPGSLGGQLSPGAPAGVLQALATHSLATPSSSPLGPTELALLQDVIKTLPRHGLKGAGGRDAGKLPKASGWPSKSAELEQSFGEKSEKGPNYDWMQGGKPKRPPQVPPQTGPLQRPPPDETGHSVLGTSPNLPGSRQNAKLEVGAKSSVIANAEGTGANRYRSLKEALSLFSLDPVKDVDVGDRQLTEAERLSTPLSPPQAPPSKDGVGTRSGPREDASADDQSSEGPHSEPPPVPAPYINNLGSRGHPELCARPCIYSAAGGCGAGKDCGFCHVPHTSRVAHLDKRHREHLKAMPLPTRAAIVLPLMKEKVAELGLSEHGVRLIPLLESAVIAAVGEIPEAAESAAQSPKYRTLRGALRKTHGLRSLLSVLSSWPDTPPSLRGGAINEAFDELRSLLENQRASAQASSQLLQQGIKAEFDTAVAGSQEAAPEQDVARFQ